MRMSVFLIQCDMHVLDCANEKPIGSRVACCKDINARQNFAQEPRTSAPQFALSSMTFKLFTRVETFACHEHVAQQFDALCNRARAHRLLVVDDVAVDDAERVVDERHEHEE